MSTDSTQSAKDRAIQGDTETVKKPIKKKEETDAETDDPEYSAPTKADVFENALKFKTDDFPLIPGSVDPSYKLKESYEGDILYLTSQGVKETRKGLIRGEEGLIHVRVIDYASPRDNTGQEKTKFHTTVKKFSPEQFVRLFGGNYSNNNAYANITTPFVIYLICKNINRGEIRDRFEDKILSATKGKGKPKRDKFIDGLLIKAKSLKIVGSHLTIKAEDFLHIPKASKLDPFGYDEKLKDFFPSNV